MKTTAIAFITALAGTAAGLLGRSQYERKHMTVRECTVTLPERAAAFDGLKAVFLSDLHDNELGDHNADLIGAICRESPDIVLVGGDMPTVKPWRKKDFSSLKELFQVIAGEYPVYYGLGNHEQRMKEERYASWWEEYRGMLESLNIVVLDNASIQIARGSEHLRITGLSLGDEFYRKGRVKKAGRAAVEKLVGPRTEEDYEILLAHNPVYLGAYAGWGADLVLSGHLHGGTIRIPGLGGLMTPQLQFFSRYTKGDLTEEGTRMLVSAGLGTHSINIRLNNKPELISITFRAR